MSMSPEFAAVWLPLLEETWAAVYPDKVLPLDIVQWFIQNTHSQSIASVPADRMNGRTLSDIAGKFLDLEGNVVDENPAANKPVLIAGAEWPAGPGAMMGRCKACGEFLGLSQTSRELIKNGSLPVCRGCFDLLMYVEGSLRAASST